MVISLIVPVTLQLLNISWQYQIYGHYKIPGQYVLFVKSYKDNTTDSQNEILMVHKIHIILSHFERQSEYAEYKRFMASNSCLIESPFPLQ